MVLLPRVIAVTVFSINFFGLGTYQTLMVAVVEGFNQLFQEHQLGQLVKQEDLEADREALALEV